MSDRHPEVGPVVTVSRSRLTLVAFADPASHDAWRDHPEHRAAQIRGIADDDAAGSTQVGTTSYVSDQGWGPLA